MTVLLQGIVGSTAYGLANADSDIDRLGVFAVPTTDLFKLTPPRESYVTTDPDLTLHEIGKFCKLALNCNPTIMELLWLYDYEVYKLYGWGLIRRRSHFLSAQRVRNAYLGYATQQFTRLKNRNDGTFSSDTKKRTAKHARHLARLCWQGI